MARLLRAAEAARVLGVAPQTLARWRVEGRGPRYRKVSSRVLYDASDVDAFAVAHPLRHGTRDTTVEPRLSGTAPLDAADVAMLDRWLARLPADALVRADVARRLLAALREPMEGQP